MMVLKPGETVQLLKLWPQKHEDLSSIPSTHVTMSSRRHTLAISALVKWKHMKLTDPVGQQLAMSLISQLQAKEIPCVAGGGCHS